MKYVAAKPCKINIFSVIRVRNDRDSRSTQRIELTKRPSNACPTHRGGNPNAASSCSGSRLLLPRLAMLRLRDPQASLWDELLPPQTRTLSAELTAVDACLADDRVFEPYRQRFRTLIGRPTVPVEAYLRLMYLKHRYRLGYEMLVREV